MEIPTSEKLLNMLDQITNGIANVNASTLQFTFVNKAFEKWFNVTRDKITGLHIKDVIGGDNYLSVEKSIAKVRDGDTVSNEITIDTASGKRWIKIDYLPVFDNDGQVSTIDVVTFDITEHRHLLEHLNDSQHIAKIGSWEWNLQTNQIWWSDETYQIFGVTPQSFTPDFKSNATFIHPDDLDLYSRTFENSLKTGEQLEIDLRLVTGAKNVIYIHASGKVICNDSGEPVRFVGTVIDVSERKLLQEQAQKAQKLEFLGLLAGGIAHDFNNLMSGIFGFIDIAIAQSTEINVTKNLSKALNAIDRTRALTQQLMTFAKGGSPVRSTDRLFPFIQETAQFALSGTNISCHFDIQKDLWSCNFDKNQIGRVVDNLVINAKQAMSEGGRIELSARNVALTEKEHSVLECGRYVKISIKDNGTGIPKELHSRIFDPFFTTKATGHGLGLATCYSIVSKHGGCIDVDSEPGCGSTFHIYLPAVLDNVDALEKKQR